jgi:hypothetical protein
MRGTPKDLEALWDRNKKLRKKAESRKLSPPEMQSLPARLRLPFKVHGPARPKFRAEALFKYLLQLSVAYQDKRFDDCISALFEHEIIVSSRMQRLEYNQHQSTHRFSRKPRLEYNQHQQSKLLAELRARVERGMSERRACQEVAAEWGLPSNSFETAWKQVRRLRSRG